MNKLLERILDIVANDAFPDEDKPYIIKEVIDTYNDNSKLCYPAGSRVELGWGDGYDCGYNQAKHDIGTSQQREPDERYQKGKAEGYAIGYQKGLDEKAMQHVTDIFTVRKTSKEEGYQAGYQSCRSEIVSAVVNTINNLKHTTGGIPK